MKTHFLSFDHKDKSKRQELRIGIYIKLERLNLCIIRLGEFLRLVAFIFGKKPDYIFEKQPSQQYQK